ncbi:MAG TPA: hypothetical protein VM692_13810 [Gammaproteobacteria bacterium]|nr:hypothetical protein [Gammaproteobacteria bacterium]
MTVRIICICIATALPCGAIGGTKPMPASHFVTSAQCIACHSSLTAPSGEDVSIGFDWRATIMANSARDPYWHAAVRRETLDNPAAAAAIEDKCATCHMPMARFDARSSGAAGEVFANLDSAAPQHALAADGVSCTLCHQIAAAGLGEQASFDGGFEIEPRADGRVIFGPHDVDAGRRSVMRSAGTYAPSTGSHLQQSSLCATCHTLYTAALDESGRSIGELPEQVPYKEWLHSDYRDSQSCQSCHMPEVAGAAPISSVLPQPREHVSQHTFLGGNAFMLAMLNRYRDDLGVKAPARELDAAAEETKRFLGTRAAALAVTAAAQTSTGVDFTLELTSTTGHKLPTAYPARRAWLHVIVTDAAGRTVFESGAVRPDGSIVGNDNDAEAARFEPHYESVTTPDEVQIYEAVMVDRDNAVTTALLRGVRFAKDNRLLPRGFDKGTAEPDVAVQGAAFADADFTAGGDRVRYRIAVDANVARPFVVSAELLYQSIGYRWAANLRSYDAPETARFARYYADSAAGSAVRVASASATVAAR